MAQRFVRPAVIVEDLRIQEPATDAAAIALDICILRQLDRVDKRQRDTALFAPHIWLVADILFSPSRRTASSAGLSPPQAAPRHGSREALAAR